MAESAIPDRKTFMRRSAEILRTLGRRTIEAVKKAPRRIAQAAKKVGGWVTKNRVVRKVASVTKAAAVKAWHVAVPVAQWSERYLLRPVAVASSAVAAVFIGSKLLVALTGLGGLAVVILIIWLWRNRHRETEISTATDNVVPIKPDEATPVVEGQVVETPAEKAEEKVQEAEAKVEEAKAEVAEAKVEAQVEALKAETDGFAPKNGSYKIRLPEGELDPDETLEQRYQVLSKLIEDERAKPAPDPEYVCELLGRQNLIRVRAGRDNRIKKDAPVATIHKDYRSTLEKDWSLQWALDHPGQEVPLTNENSGVWPHALNRGAMAENKRLNAIKRLHDKNQGSQAA